MARITFDNSSGGSDPYELPINPLTVSIPFGDDGDLIKVHSVINGYPILIKKGFDHRQGVLTWKGFAQDHTVFDAMIDILEGYRWTPSGGLTKLIHLESIADSIGWGSTYQEIKVISVVRTFADQGGYKYDNTKLIFVLA